MPASAGAWLSYFEIHPAVFRVGFVVLTLLGGAGILIYAAAALVMPDEGKEDSIATAALRNRRDRPWPLIGLGLLAVAGAVLLSRVTLWPHGDAWFLFLIAGAVILWITRQPAADPTEGRGGARRARTPAACGASCAALGIALASLVALVLVAAAIFAAVFDVHLGRGVGDRTYAVTSVQELQQRLPARASARSSSISARCSCPSGETHVDASVDVGDLSVIVPAGVALRVHGDGAGWATSSSPARRRRRPQRRRATWSRPGERVLVLDAHVGAGSVEVERAVR